jgi:sigma-B regulation protein RsbU (phosphoserine phosphatase)
VSGDYYDFVALDSGHLGIAVGDVSGKGLPAALLMASLQGALRSLAPAGNGGPARLARDLNAQVHALTERKPVRDVLLGGLGRRDGRALVGQRRPQRAVRRARVGTDRAARVRRSAARRARGSAYREERTSLARGDLLVVFTDGVTEAEDASEIEYGDERLGTLLREAADRERRLATCAAGSWMP